MIVNTRRLFTTLLSRLQISAVCDVGSMNGADALAFRAAIPQSSIYALEPNPHNFSRMAADRVLREHNIRVEPLAATNYDGHGDFFLVEADYSQTNVNCGMSFRSTGDPIPTRGISRGGPTTRLDTYLADKRSPQARFALWINTEGKAYEVIEGATGVVDHVYLLHVEVETKPLISSVETLSRSEGTGAAAGIHRARKGPAPWPRAVQRRVRATRPAAAYLACAADAAVAGRGATAHREGRPAAVSRVRAPLSGDATEADVPPISGFVSAGTRYRTAPPASTPNRRPCPERDVIGSPWTLAPSTYNSGR